MKPRERRDKLWRPYMVGHVFVYNLASVQMKVFNDINSTYQDQSANRLRESTWCLYCLLSEKWISSCRPMSILYSRKKTPTTTWLVVFRCVSNTRVNNKIRQRGIGNWEEMMLYTYSPCWRTSMLITSGFSFVVWLDYKKAMHAFKAYNLWVIWPSKNVLLSVQFNVYSIINNTWNMYVFLCNSSTW